MSWQLALLLLGVNLACLVVGTGLGFFRGYARGRVAMAREILWKDDSP